METYSFEDLSRTIMERPPRLGRVRLVAVDGRSGSGKTTFAGRLASALGERASVLHTDDLYDGWGHPTSFDERLWDWVLRPLSVGRPARYRRYDWHMGRFGTDWTELPPPEVLIMEGVSVAGSRWERLVSYRVFVDITPETGLARTLIRDGDSLRSRLEVWQRQETTHFAEDDTENSADLVVDGESSAPSIDRFGTFIGRFRETEKPRFD